MFVMAIRPSRWSHRWTESTCRSYLLVVLIITIAASVQSSGYISRSNNEPRRMLMATNAAANQEYQLLPNARCVDPLIKNLWNSNPWDCRRRCSDMRICGAWSFTKPARKCELHTGCTQKTWDDSYQSADKVSVSSTLTYNTREDFRCAGPPLEAVWAPSSGGCRSRCTNNPLCGAFSNRKKGSWCQLFQRCNEGYEDIMYQTGLKVFSLNDDFLDEASDDSKDDESSSSSPMKDSPPDSSPSSESSSAKEENNDGPSSDSLSDESDDSKDNEPGADNGLSSESPAKEGPWKGCGSRKDGWLEAEIGIGCFNSKDGFDSKAAKNDRVGGMKYDGSWEGCKSLCSLSGKGEISSAEWRCRRGFYVTHNKETGGCYLYKPHGERNGCESWRELDSDRLGMYCGPAGDDSSDSGTPAGDSSESFSEDKEDSSDDGDDRDDDEEEDSDDEEEDSEEDGDSEEEVEEGDEDSEEDGDSEEEEEEEDKDSEDSEEEENDEDSEDEKKYDRTYSGWLGERCAGSDEIRSVDCELDDEKSCVKFCAAECDKEKNCLAFNQDYTSSCTLYSRCDIVVIDGCDDCTVSVCLENCPEGTPEYYIRRDGMGQDCNSGNEIETIMTGCDDDATDCALGLCAEKCLDEPECNQFMVSLDYSKCELYTACDLDYHDDADSDGLIGYFRQPK